MNLSPSPSNGLHTRPSSFWPAFRIRLGLCGTFLCTGSDGCYKLHVDEIVARNETACRTHRMDFICTLAYYSMHFESVRVGVNPSPISGSDGHYKLRADEIMV